MDGEDQPIEIGNEFAMVHVQKVYTRNGVRLRVSSPRLHTSIELDALALESLTWQTMDTFSGFLATPFGDRGSGHAHGADGSGVSYTASTEC